MWELSTSQLAGGLLTLIGIAAWAIRTLITSQNKHNDERHQDMRVEILAIKGAIAESAQSQHKMMERIFHVAERIENFAREAVLKRDFENAMDKAKTSQEYGDAMLSSRIETLEGRVDRLEVSAGIWDHKPPVIIKDSIETKKEA